ncbi:MAG TPA: hypothetical protein VLI90_16365 [Tepidisphaeraceae bacterium]|nr:hypothetical protein [Tepidisphaeraceae bacterium]
MRFSRTVASLAMALAVVSCKSANNHADKEAEEGNEVKMKLDQVPPAVRDSLTREAGGAQVGDVDKESKDGRTVYETDAMINGTNYEIKVDEAGKLISKKIDNEADEKKGEKEEGK